MKNLKNAAEISMEKWMEAIPDDIPEVEFSVEHENKMLKISRTAKKKKIAVKTVIRIAAAAALTVVLAVVCVYGDTGVNEYTITSVYGRLVYAVDDPYDGNIKEDLTIDYVPAGYVLAEESVSDKAVSAVYTASSIDISQLHISKYVSSKEISLGFKQYADRYYTEKKGVYDYVVYVAGTSKTVVWNNENYVYEIYCPICDLTDEEILEIAYNVK